MSPPQRGGGFAGLAVCRRLRRRFDVTLVDAKQHLGRDGSRCRGAWHTMCHDLPAHMDRCEFALRWTISLDHILCIYNV